MDPKILFKKYQIVRALPHAGEGEVYEGIDLASDRRVMLKMSRVHRSDDPNRLEQARQEIQGITRLRHDHILHVHDVFIQDDGCGVVTEFFPGQDLKRLLHQKGRLACDQAISILRQVADALAHAHQEAVIHRDIRPENIIVNSRGHAKLANFGMPATMGVATSAGDASHLFDALQYLSPEQARGDFPDARSDLFSLGMVFHALLTGRTAYSGFSDAALIAKIHSPEAVPLAFTPEVPIPLQEIVAALVRKNRTDRMPNAAAVLEAIRAYEATACDQRLAEHPPPSPATSEETVAPSPREMPQKAAPVEDAPRVRPPIRRMPSSAQDPSVPGRTWKSYGITAAVFIVTGALVFFFFSNKKAARSLRVEQESLSPPPISTAPQAPSPRTMEADRARVAAQSEAEQARAVLDAAQDRLRRARSEAEAADAPHHATQLHREGIHLEAAGLADRTDATQRMEQGQYEEALPYLVRAGERFAQAEDRILKAAEVARAAAQKIKAKAEAKRAEERRAKAQEDEAAALKARTVIPVVAPTPIATPGQRDPILAPTPPRAPDAADTTDRMARLPRDVIVLLGLVQAQARQLSALRTRADFATEAAPDPLRMALEEKGRRTLEAAEKMIAAGDYKKARAELKDAKDLLRDALARFD